jgi:hypothetical protein
MTLSKLGSITSFCPVQQLTTGQRMKGSCPGRQCKGIERNVQCFTSIYYLGKDSPLAATLHSRPKDVRADQTPAPGDYNPEKYENFVHDNAPKYTFGLKTQVEKPSQTPGTVFLIICMHCFH